MQLLPDLTHRVRIDEIMDDPHIAMDRHHNALHALRRINLFSRSAQIVAAPIVQLAGQNPGRTLRILDIASGGGDVVVGLWHIARKNNCQLHIAGLDISERAIDFARQYAHQRNAEVRFFHHDVLSTPLPEGYDVIMCSLFFHHLEDAQAVYLLRSMHQAAESTILINDLDRSRIGYMLARWGSHLLTRSDVVHVDAERSVRAAFTPDEMRTLARQAGLSNATIHRRWPWRWLLQWSRA